MERRNVLKPSPQVLTAHVGHRRTIGRSRQVDVETDLGGQLLGLTALGCHR